MVTHCLVGTISAQQVLVKVSLTSEFQENTAPRPNGNLRAIDAGDHMDVDAVDDDDDISDPSTSTTYQNNLVARPRPGWQPHQLCSIDRFLLQQRLTDTQQEI